MENKLHYDVKFIEMLAPKSSVAAAGTPSLDTVAADVCVTGADRISVLVQWLSAAVDAIHTIKMYKTNVGGTGDTELNFSISEITEATGAYGAWTDVVVGESGYPIAISDNANGTHMYLIEIDKNEFTPIDDFATPLEYVSLKMTEGTSETGVMDGCMTAILYGLKYQNED